MFSRTFSALAAALALAACGAPEAETPQASADGPRIACALGDGAAFEPDCTVERSETPDGPLLTLRHPDGGFRRLQVVGDGRGVIAADGAAAAEVILRGDTEIEVALDGDRYRLPARLGAAR
jgi:hypothetical protein